MNERIIGNDRMPVNFTLQTTKDISQHGVNNATIMRAMNSRYGKKDINMFMSDKLNIADGMNLALGIAIYEIASKWCSENITSGIVGFMPERVNRTLIGLCMLEMGVLSEFAYGFTSYRAENARKITRNHFGHRRYLELCLYVTRGLEEYTIKIMPNFDRIMELNDSRMKFREEIQTLTAELRALRSPDLILSKVVRFARKYGLSEDDVRDYCLKLGVYAEKKK